MVKKTTKKHNFWLMKSEPSAYSISDLKRDKRTLWDGIRNYQVRNMMRDDMEVGDMVLFYHSNTEPIGVAGVMEISKKAEPDPTQFDKTDNHFDAKSSPESPRWLAVTVKFKSKFTEVVSLSELRARKELSDLRILQPGNRLSVVPVSKKHFDLIVKMGNK